MKKPNIYKKMYIYIKKCELKGWNLKGWKNTVCLLSSRDTKHITAKVKINLQLHCAELFICIYKDMNPLFCCERWQTLHFHPRAVGHNLNPPALDNEQLRLIC